MVDKLRTLLARFIVDHLTRPRPLVVQAWLWLDADSQGVENKRRSLNAILELDPENEPTSLALLVPDQERPTS